MYEIVTRNLYRLGDKEVDTLPLSLSCVNYLKDTLMHTGSYLSVMSKLMTMIVLSLRRPRPGRFKVVVN